MIFFKKRMEKMDINSNERILYIEYVDQEKKIINKLLEVKRNELKKEWIRDGIAQRSSKSEMMECLEFLIEFQISKREFIYIIFRLCLSDSYMDLLRRIKTYLYLTRMHEKEKEFAISIGLNCNTLKRTEYDNEERAVDQIRENLSKSLGESFRFNFLRKLKPKKKIEILLAELESRILLQVSHIESEIQCLKCTKYLLNLELNCISKFWPFCSMTCLELRTFETGNIQRIVSNKKFKFSSFS